MRRTPEVHDHDVHFHQLVAASSHNLLWTSCLTPHTNIKVLFWSNREMCYRKYIDLQSVIHLESLKIKRHTFFFIFNQKELTGSNRFNMQHLISCSRRIVQFHYQMQTDENILHAGCFMWEASWQPMINDVLSPQRMMSGASALFILSSSSNLCKTHILLAAEQRCTACLCVCVCVCVLSGLFFY